MGTIATKPWTVECFLAWEDQQEGRHEFDGERVVDMTGGTRAHQIIVFNLLASLKRRLDRARFDVLQEMRLRTGRQIRYPDVVVHAGRIPNTAVTLTDAMVVFEVLSDSTATIDRDDKPLAYAALPSLRSYVLIAQDAPGVELLMRPDALAPLASRAIGANAVPLPELGIDLPLADIYADLLA